LHVAEDFKKIEKFCNVITRTTMLLVFYATYSDFYVAFFTKLERKRYNF
jgi:hypothetical protein